MATGSVWQRLTGEKPSKPGLLGRLREEQNTFPGEDQGQRTQESNTEGLFHALRRAPGHLYLVQLHLMKDKLSHQQRALQPGLWNGTAQGPSLNGVSRPTP